MMFDEAATVWVMISTAMILLMTPAVALFYGGMLRKESMLSMLGQCLLIMGVITLVWVGVGYSFVFGGDVNGLIGNFNNVLLNGLNASTPSTFASSIPSLLYMMFQGAFAIIAVALIVGGSLRE